MILLKKMLVMWPDTRGITFFEASGYRIVHHSFEFDYGLTSRMDTW